ncbi:MAG: tRNA pseudouridine(38-40) synthase TruA [Anaerolineae bacterium]|nr:tRNA pseudouridine(38-40) synthase TruA [Chloroflexota bacterium]MBP6297765.1 tRNA pseudouridine(38-40) synthase TruA [Anaerolineae bacterium]
MRYRTTLAYDGSAYWGFQRQAGNAPTVQAAVEAAIFQITAEHSSVIAAGRTDTGVHATGQVIAFDLEGWQHGAAVLTKALNTALPDDISIRDTREAPGFHPRFDALSRRYAYTVLQADVRDPLLWKRAWWVEFPLDLAVMQSSAGLLLGTHDFATFGRPPQGTNTVRTVFDSRWTAEPARVGTLYRYEVEANAFLQHQVRRMVGMLVDVGRGGLAVTDFELRFRSADLRQARRAAPPHGLILEAVRYRD